MSILRTDPLQNMGCYLGGLLAGVAIACLLQLGVPMLVLLFEGSPILALGDGIVGLWMYILYQCAVAFLAVWIATRMSPEHSRRVSCWCFWGIGLTICTIVYLEMIRPFERHLHNESLMSDILTEPLVPSFFVGGFCCAIYMTLKSSRGAG